MNNKFGVTIVIPTYNEAKTIKLLLENLLNQSCLPSKIIVVDGGSQDGTPQIVQQYTNQNVQLISLDHSLPGRGRNVGVAHAVTEIVAFVDAGIDVPTTWLSNLIEPILNAGADVCFGKRLYKSDILLDKILISLTYGCKGTTRAVANMALKTECFKQIGSFPEDLRAGEDLVWLKKLYECKAELSIQTNESAVNFYTQFPDTLLEIFKKWVSFSKYNILIGNWRVFFFYIGITAILGFLGLMNVWLMTFVFALYVFRTFCLTVRNECFQINEYIKRPYILLYVLVVALIVDVARGIGQIQGFFLWIRQKYQNLAS